MDFECKTVIFVIVQDYGHFHYTTNLAYELHNRGLKVEYWSHLSAEGQIPEFATFEWLSNDRRFTNFYCRESCIGDSDSDNIERMSSNINQLVNEEYGDDDPLINLTGNPERIALLQRRLVSREVAFCVNDKCHVFSWVAEFCERVKVPILNLCPSQHEIQRQHAGLLDRWKSIFGNMTPRSRHGHDDEVASCQPLNSAVFTTHEAQHILPVYPADVEVPVVPGLYITYAPLVPDVGLIPQGRVVVGPVYPPPSLKHLQEEAFIASRSAVRRWLDHSSDSRPVIYVSLGSMVEVDNSTATTKAACRRLDATRAALRTLFRALVRDGGGSSSNHSNSVWRVLVAMTPDNMVQLFHDTAPESAAAATATDMADSVGCGAELIAEAMERGDMLCAGWVPQFQVLGHSAVKAFVSHCGANSVHESIYHQKPIVAMPFFDDQRYNGPRLVELGLSPACLLRDSLTEVMVTSAVRNALSDEAIARNLHRASAQAKAADGLERLVTEALSLAEFSSSHINLRVN